MKDASADAASNVSRLGATTSRYTAITCGEGAPFQPARAGVSRSSES